MTLRICLPLRLKSATSTTASSPSSRAVSPPSRHQTSAPSSLQPITAGAQACLAASSRNAWIAPGQASGSPMGSPLASMTPETTRYPTQDLPVGDQITLLSWRSVK